MKFSWAPAVFFLFYLTFDSQLTASSPIPDGRILTGQGELMSLDIDSKTLLVEVLLNGNLHTVAGTLLPDVLLKKKGEITDLSAFKVGDIVRIGWRKTETGHCISFIESVKNPKVPHLKGMYYFSATHRVIGYPHHHIIKKKETLLDVARQYGLGINEIQDLYPQIDPWIPPEGMQLVVPTQWILPDAKPEGIVVNLAEFRMFYFPKNQHLVKTYPLGIGDEDWTTPLGIYRITGKEINPTWYIPSSLQHKYNVKSIPPGPDNPLGKYWMTLGNTSYGIHGSDIPWSVGRLVTHGCIRMYPEDIEQLFGVVMPGTRVKIIYEPVKIGLFSNRVFVEVHRDIYDKIEDLPAYGQQRLQEMGLINRVDMEKFRKALEYRNGLPVDVTISN